MIKVLIAEDNAVNRELLRELLELRGYTVLEACDGQEARRLHAQRALLESALRVHPGAGF